MKNIIIAGGSGFLGQALENHFIKIGYTVKILTRNPKKENDIFWDAKTLGNWASELDSSEALINLTGKSVDCRYTDKNKKEIYDSRIDSTQILGKVILQCNQPPKVWMNASTATIYRHSLDKKMTEQNGETGDDFSMNIAKAWEKAFNEFDTPKTRKIVLRTSIVMGKNGGAFIPLKTLANLGLGGKQGKGNQKVSFIHEKDFARAVEFLLTHPELEGIFNVTVPNPTNNKLLMNAIRKEVGISFGISHPTWLLKFGAKIIGTETELVLKSRNVVPERLLKEGFVFEYLTIENTVSSLLN
ncbi:TIGR01777 family oxidoreductase [Aureibaculum sp. 2210JD6-5]|uniref:TIGR01777 family oxidoreductase n=1 Tax=Aureibaculum sp. 2210JD6-5 TaxID=3103957 RepID=UPI002AAE0877|nr:TIGR01777 family oxidoreductase [Aureibaculum sp. 2210JD6-5]MDY7396482.1 TIGR01777 family oxidoreductase [Aureibaculum sp. 2210JD6-5]